MLLNPIYTVKNKVISILITKNKLFSIQPDSIDTFNILISIVTIAYTNITSNGLFPLNSSCYSFAVFIIFTINIVRKVIMIIYSEGAIYLIQGYLKIRNKLSTKKPDKIKFIIGDIESSPFITWEIPDIKWRIILNIKIIIVDLWSLYHVFLRYSSSMDWLVYFKVNKFSKLVVYSIWNLLLF